MAELFQDGGSKLVAVDRFRQIVLKPWRAHTGISHAAPDEGDGRHAASLAYVHVAKPFDELPVGRLRRGEVAHDDVGDEGDSDGIDGARRGDDGAPQFEHRPKEVARELVVIDHQDVNPTELYRRSIHLVCFRALQDGLHVAAESVVDMPSEPESPRASE